VAAIHVAGMCCDPCGSMRWTQSNALNHKGHKNGSTEHSKGNKTVPEKVATTRTEGHKNGSTEHSKGNKTVPEKVATTRTEDGHK